MTTSIIYFVDGPWEGETREHPSVVPSEVIPVYADARRSIPCQSPQVVKKLGRYRKTSRRIDIPLYSYLWEPENN